MTRGMTLVDTPLVVFTDANTMVNREAIQEIVLAFQDPKVGCVAGENGSPYRPKTEPLPVGKVFTGNTNQH